MVLKLRTVLKKICIPKFSYFSHWCQTRQWNYVIVSYFPLCREVLPAKYQSEKMVQPAKRNYASAKTISKTSTKKAKKSHACEGYEDMETSRNAARERHRVRSLRNAFLSLQQCLPSVPPNTKLSKLDVLILATTYISHLSRILSEDKEINPENGLSMSDFDFLDGSVTSIPEVDVRSLNWEKSYLHPVKKWPMRSRLYAGVEDERTTVKECSVATFQQRNYWS
ncbi:transcription factor 23 [Nephila pilipes]|uniref:Transcription factor 23 n=1 Tax=Nephila pilipes TaxID=299642 RepID=A0A8X6TW90_NEPPI|nr:transcription factor 23 [Nephila pilipes]